MNNEQFCNFSCWRGFAIRAIVTAELRTRRDVACRVSTCAGLQPVRKNGTDYKSAPAWVVNKGIHPLATNEQ